MYAFRPLLFAALGALLVPIGTPSSFAQNSPSESVPVEAGQTFTGRVVDVKDGDTFDVRRSIGGEVTIRLHGVDAPESAQPYDTGATRAGRRSVGGKSVRVSVEDIGRYEWTVARIEVRSRDSGTRAQSPGPD